MSAGRERATTTASMLPGLPLYRLSSVPRSSSKPPPPRTSVRPARSPSRCSSSSSPRAIARASRPSAVELSAFRSGGSRTTATSASLPPAGSIAFSTAFAIPGSRPPRATRATRWSRSRPPTIEGNTAWSKSRSVPSSPCRESISAARRVEVGLQAPLDVVGGPGDDVGAEPDADQDPDREREEHGGQRGRVVASRVPHQRFRATLIFSHTRSKNSASAGELSTMITISASEITRNAHMCQPRTPGL